MAAGDSLKRKDRKAMGLGFKKTPSKAKAKKKVTLRSSQAKAKASTANRKYGSDYAKTRKIRATNAQKRAGTSSNYDPLSSISVKVPKVKKARNPKAQPKKERALKNSKSAKRRTKRSK